MTDPKISLADVKKFFSTEKNPVGTEELVDFWRSLSNSEKEELRKQFPKN